MARAHEWAWARAEGWRRAGPPRGARGPGAVHMAGRGGSGVCGDLGYPALLATQMEELVQADAGPLPVQCTCLGVGFTHFVTGRTLTSGACV